MVDNFDLDYFDPSPMPAGSNDSSSVFNTSFNPASGFDTAFNQDSIVSTTPQPSSITLAHDFSKSVDQAVSSGTHTCSTTPEIQNT